LLERAPESGAGGKRNPRAGIARARPGSAPFHRRILRERTRSPTHAGHRGPCSSFSAGHQQGAVRRLPAPATSPFCVDLYRGGRGAQGSAASGAPPFGRNSGLHFSRRLGCTSRGGNVSGLRHCFVGTFPRDPQQQSLPAGGRSTQLAGIGAHGITYRRKGDAVRLEIEADADPEIIDRLRTVFELDPCQVFPVAGPLNLSRLFNIYDKVDRPDLKYRSFAPRELRLTAKSKDLFEELRRHDILLHHPFDSYEAAISFSESAAADDNVLSIKQTLYRTNEQSLIVPSLIDAASRKEVTAEGEFKGRFRATNQISAAPHPVYDQRPAYSQNGG